jgi:hypothetical protein
MSDYFDRVESELRAALRRSAQRPWYARLRGRRRALILVFAGLVVAGPALAAAGVFQTGTPVGASVPAIPNAFQGVAIPSSIQLLPLRVADPDGGPPWGVRLLRTTRGVECAEIGRIVNGRLGALGQDGAFHNDGRFHPFSTNYFANFVENCGTLDGRGHAYASNDEFGFVANGLQPNTDGTCSPDSAVPRALRGLWRPPPPARPIPNKCPAAALRDFFFGLLGPDATSVTYTSATGKSVTVRTASPDGAYLIVLPHDASFAGVTSVDASLGEAGSATGGTTPSDFIGNPIREIHYSDTAPCLLPRYTSPSAERAGFYSAVRAAFPTLTRHLSISAASPGFLGSLLRHPAVRRWLRAHGSLIGARSCATVGYTAPRIHRVTVAEVATPITVHTELAESICTSPDEIMRRCGSRLPPGYTRVPAIAARSSLLVTLTWRGRVTIPNQDSHYEIYINATPTAEKDGCGGGTSFGPTETNLRAGQTVTYTTLIPLRCPGITHGNVSYVQDIGAAGSTPVPAQPGEGPDIRVGSFTISVP